MPENITKTQTPNSCGTDHLEQVNSYKCLSSLIIQDDKTTKEIKAIIAQAIIAIMNHN